MKYEQDIEKLLADAPVPTVVSGPHRTRLKNELLGQMRRKETEMRVWKSMVSTAKRKIAFACCAALILVASAWGAEKAYKKISAFFTHESVIVDTVPPEKITTPDGREVFVGSTLGVSVGYGSEDPTFSDAKLLARV